MATPSEWVQGARPKTLPVAVSPVAVGTGAAAALGHQSFGYALLALVVALALQIGVNYANDYSDGIRGTDDDRVGPFRLTGSRAAEPATVKRAAIGALALGALLGVVLIAIAGVWSMLVVGAAAVAVHLERDGCGLEVGGGRARPYAVGDGVQQSRGSGQGETQRRG